MITSRSGSQGTPTTPPPQSIEAVRRRARHRLIGASVLVLLGVLGFPLLFDTQPRPISVDIPIEIPAKNPAPALPAPKAAAPSSKTEPKPVPAPVETAALSAGESLGAREEIVEPTRPAAAAAPETDKSPQVEAKVKPAPVEKPEPVAKPPAPAPAAEADRAQPQDKPASPAAVRAVVQVGAFADAARAREVRLKLERAGLKTYTHVAETPDGKRIRVRLGPFASKSEADKAAARVKALGLPAAVLTL
jgi:DedD protein